MAAAMSRDASESRSPSAGPVEVLEPPRRRLLQRMIAGQQRQHAEIGFGRTPLRVLRQLLFGALDSAFGALGNII